jgi:holliday junction DNA helicase RuvA
MIAGVRGMVQRLEASSVVLAVGPVDLRVALPGRTLSTIAPGQELSLRTYLYVREDQLALFGFRTGDELDLFEALLLVSGVGPKAALSILSAFEASEVRRAINQGDSHLLTRAQGIGARVAARIVTDLQGKIPMVDTDVEQATDAQAGAVAALIALGYSGVEAKRAVESVGPSDAVEDLVRSALGFLADR